MSAIIATLIQSHWLNTARNVRQSKGSYFFEVNQGLYWVLCRGSTGHVKPLQFKKGSHWRSISVAFVPLVSLHTPYPPLQDSLDLYRLIDPLHTLNFHISKVSTAQQRVGIDW
jgi:hypothetical protein